MFRAGLRGRPYVAADQPRSAPGLADGSHGSPRPARQPLYEPGYDGPPRFEGAPEGHGDVPQDELSLPSVPAAGAAGRRHFSRRRIPTTTRTGRIRRTHRAAPGFYQSPHVPRAAIAAPTQTRRTPSYPSRPVRRAGARGRCQHSGPVRCPAGPRDRCPGLTLARCPGPIPARFRGSVTARCPVMALVRCRARVQDPCHVPVRDPCHVWVRDPCRMPTRAPHRGVGPGADAPA